VAAVFATQFFNLDELNWLLQRLSVYLALAILVIFQPEIRRALAELGKQHRFTNNGDEGRVVDAIVQAALLLSERKIGALVAIEREIGTRSIQETGTRIASPVSSELLATLFYPNTPLHDGGVVIAGNAIMAAGCLFPLSQRAGLTRTLGMRHRAALGISEETDALVVVVSEETGTISVAYKGHLSRDFTEERLRKLLTKVLTRRTRGKSAIWRIKEQLDLTPEGVAKTEALKAEEGNESER
jgi:diadenylate cyclase